MAVDDPNASPERHQTDESLRTERENADRALAQRQEEIELDADLVVQRARDNADAVLSAARDKADQLLDTAAPDAVAPATIERERVLEDAALRSERAVADQSVQREREETAHVLAMLLPLEREKTDRFLLTERARSDHALANRDDFLGIVSHDLRNLLGGIVLSAAVLSKHATDDEQGRQTLAETKRIERYAARMNRLIGDLLDVASIDAGKLAMQPALSDPALLIAEAVDTFRGPASAKGISLDSAPLEQLAPASFDHDRILQVLANLITNAIKFTPGGGAIVIACERAGDALRFSVSDDGVGIPEDMLDAIFQRFWQVGANDRRGLGLGLYIAKAIVEAHGGTIVAQSPPGGAGSRFCFSLPAPVLQPGR